MSRITSLHNPHVAAAAGLRDSRRRQKQGRILIDGAREISRAASAGVQIIEAFVCPALCQSADARQAAVQLEAAGAAVFEVTEAVFAKLAYGQRADGVVAVAGTPAADLARLDALLNARALDRPQLIAVLAGVEKPGNVGAVLRSADGAGLDAVVVADSRTDLYNPNAIRASLGTIFTMPLGAADAEDTLAWLRRRELTVYAARVEGAVSYTEVDYRRPCAIVLGSEAQGLGPLWHAADITAVRLPMRGTADSLNVSAAAAVLFYEALRQRGD